MIIVLTKSPLCILSDIVPKTEESNILFDVWGVEKSLRSRPVLEKLLKWKVQFFRAACRIVFELWNLLIGVMEFCDKRVTLT